jgi:hypothetical protein
MVVSVHGSGGMRCRRCERRATPAPSGNSKAMRQVLAVSGCYQIVCNGVLLATRFSVEKSYSPVAGQYELPTRSHDTIRQVIEFKKLKFLSRYLVSTWHDFCLMLDDGIEQCPITKFPN